MRPLIIVGGGLAGLTLGILLRRREVPVQIWEAGHYPRHRVCGEFISGAGRQLLQELIPGAELPHVDAKTVQFHMRDSATPVLELPAPALSVSRWDLDNCLAERFVREGGELLCGRRWTEPFSREGVVRGTGRQLDPQRSGWVGVKMHASALELQADLEMYFSPAGYVGLSRLPHAINVCALISADTLPAYFRKDPLSAFEPLLSSKMNEKLRQIQVDRASVCAVSGISFQAQTDRAECCIGDASRMIPPFTGNGMSLAIESAYLSVAPLVRYATGQSNWEALLAEIRRKAKRRFRDRFTAAALLQQLANRNWTQRLAMSTLKAVPSLFKAVYGSTR